MKKLISLTLAILCVFSLASCLGGSSENTCTAHKDADGNMYCDTCNAIYICPDHKDANEDKSCDTCGAPYACSGHADANKDGKCDKCKASYTCPGHEDSTGSGQCDICNAKFVCEHVDANNDGSCDKCKAYFTCATHQDNNADGKCDFCKGKFVCNSHKDANSDAACDVCGKSYACPGHIDADEDGACDECGAFGSALNSVSPESVAAFVRAYQNSLPTKVTTSTSRTVGNSGAAYTLNTSSVLVTGTVSGNAASIYESVYFKLRDVESGSGNTVMSVYQPVKQKLEFIAGKGVRETIDDGLPSGWNPRKTNFAPTKGSIALEINENNIKVNKFTIEAEKNLHVMEFTVSKANVETVFGMNGAVPNVDATSDVNVVLTGNGATITSVVITYTVAGTKDVPVQNVKIEVNYDYSIQNITID